jgi:hypothetical protein
MLNEQQQPAAIYSSETSMTLPEDGRTGPDGTDAADPPQYSSDEAQMRSR